MRIKRRTFPEFVGTKLFQHSDWYWNSLFWLRRNFSCWLEHGSIQELAGWPYEHGGWWCENCMKEVTPEELKQSGYRSLQSFYGAVPDQLLSREKIQRIREKEVELNDWGASVLNAIGK